VRRTVRTNGWLVWSSSWWSRWSIVAVKLNSCAKSFLNIEMLEVPPPANCFVPPMHWVIRPHTCLICEMRMCVE
jgi:hypothetical protein